jgi:hypothetical protein
VSALTAAIAARLGGDPELASLLAGYRGGPAVFTVDPAPEDAELPYIVTAGEVTQTPADTKTGRGRQVWRDVRCYAAADGSAVTVEAMAERVRTLLHRSSALDIDGFRVTVAECSGPVAADELDAYGRIVTVRLIMREVRNGEEWS